MAVIPLSQNTHRPVDKRADDIIENCGFFPNLTLLLFAILRQHNGNPSTV